MRESPFDYPPHAGRITRRREAAGSTTAHPRGGAKVQKGLITPRGAAFQQPGEADR